VAAILDGPVITVHLENTLCVGVPSAGDTVGNFARGFTALLLCGPSFDHERLSDMREVEVIVEIGCGPDSSDLDSPVVRGRMLNEIRLLSVFEVALDIFTEPGLIPFDGEMIVGLTPDQIGGYRALSQEGIGSDVLAQDVDGFRGAEWPS